MVSYSILQGPGSSEEKVYWFSVLVDQVHRHLGRVHQEGGGIDHEGLLSDLNQRLYVDKTSLGCGSNGFGQLLLDVDTASIKEQCNVTFFLPGS